jgi:hypothetical protein
MATAKKAGSKPAPRKGRRQSAADELHEMLSAEGATAAGTRATAGRGPRPSRVYIQISLPAECAVRLDKAVEKTGRTRATYIETLIDEATAATR